MNCTDYQKEVMLYHAGELPPEHKSALDAHLQLCADCARFNHEIDVAAGAFRDGRLPENDVDLWPQVRERIAPRPFAVPRWALVPALSLLLLGAMQTKIFFHISAPMTRADAEIVRDMEFLTDYDLWEDLDTLEHTEQV